MYAFHVIALPHTQTTKEYLLCAYTQKIRNFCIMMMSLGHKVYLYGAEDNDADCTEFISCITKDEQKILFGEYDWHSEFFKIDWSPTAPCWITMNTKAILEISKRQKEKDFICISMGGSQKLIADAFPNLMSVEIGIGYEGVFSDYKVFESYAWMHSVYSYIDGGAYKANGRNFDCVIPNYFDSNDFPFCDKKENYFLYIGRLIERKGYTIAIETCKTIDAKLIIAGQGKLEQEYSNVTHIGTVDVKERGELMSKARAVFVPTIYVEPFGGVAVESMMCGTPVICSDWGAFTETVQDGITGFRCHTLQEFVNATKNVGKLDYAKIRKYATDHYSMDVIKHKYQKYFDKLMTLWSNGWYQIDNLE